MNLGLPFVDGAAARVLVDAGATVLDTRGATSFFAGHVPGAQRADWRAVTAGGFRSGRIGEPAAAAAVYAGLGVDRSRPVLVVGEWTAAWGEEGRVAWDLTWLGHAAVRILHGGAAAWSGAWERLPSRPRVGTFTAAPRSDLRISTAELAGSRSERLVLDVREPEEFAGATPYGEARGGHVPGARNLPWRGLLAADPALPKNEEIVVYCTGGVRSAMAWAALTGWGYPRVRNDDGSWWEWAETQPG